MDIHITRDGQSFGPFSSEEARQRLADGEFQLTDLAWTDGLPDWVPLSTLPGFAAAESAPPAPAAPKPRAAAAGRPAEAASNQAPRPAATTGGSPPNSGLAIASLVTGILSLTLIPCFAAIAAVICGHLAKSQIKKSGGAIGGGGLALAGLIMGYVGLAFIPIFAAMAFPALGAAKEKAYEAQALNNGRQIGIACHLYAEGHGGTFPPNLNVLVPKYLPDASVLRCAIGGNKDAVGFDYFPGQRATDPMEKALLVSKGVTRQKKRVVVHVDGSARLEFGLPHPSR